MYTKAELFTMAAEQPKEIFVNNVTLSTPDDASGCVDLDAEKERLSTIWELAHLYAGAGSPRWPVPDRFCKRRRHPAAYRAELVCWQPGLPGIRPLFAG